MSKKNQEVLVVFVLDKSGSMESIRDATISGFNEYKKTQENLKKTKVDFALTIFDSTSTEYSGIKSIKEFPDLTRKTYVPGSLTPLYDAIGTTIKKVDDEGRLYDKVLFVIMTDGAENASHKYNQSKIFKMITERQEKQNWDFVYLGANQDAYSVGTAMGIQGGYTRTYDADPTATRQVMGVTGQSTASYMAASVAPENFFDIDDAKSISKKSVSKKSKSK